MESLWAVSAKGAPGVIQEYMEIQLNLWTQMRIQRRPDPILLDGWEHMPLPRRDEHWTVISQTPGGGSRNVLVTSSCEPASWSTRLDFSQQEQHLWPCPKPPTCILRTNTWRSPEPFSSVQTYRQSQDFKCWNVHVWVHYHDAYFQNY